MTHTPGVARCSSDRFAHRFGRILFASRVCRMIDAVQLVGRDPGRRVDLDTETVFVNRTKDQIKNAPEYDEDKHRKDVGYRDRYREDLGSYYGPGGAGWHDDEVI